MSQINFASHCCTTVCGNSSEHLNCRDNVLRNIYRFHVAFQTHKISYQLRVKLPYVDCFIPFKSDYNLQAYATVCNEFAVEPTTEWCYKHFAKRFVHDGKTGNYVMANTAFGWIIDQNRGFIQDGVQNLSESVRAYAFLIVI